ncbi:MAG TPA: sialidase family protein [Candidatus Thermoplasmatota archaeon]|nr:sialidase family protein [Candidatus Thermoplasmatota archaeon]
MRFPSLATAGLLLGLLLAGCSSPAGPGGSSNSSGGSDVAPVEGFAVLPKVLAPLFAKPVLIDTVRAGGEPVLAVTHKGTVLASAHPGFTHYHPAAVDPTDPGAPHVPAELLQDFAGQSYLWRSTDNGTTWTHIGLPMAPDGLGPRGPGLGVSDPEFTVMDDNTVCYTDLEALAAASTSCSTDDGLTWVTGNPIASGRPIDRQWLASYKDEFYFTGNYLSGGMNFRVSTDRGLTWTERGTTQCSSDLIANPANGHLIQGCNGVGISLSTDGGRTWGEAEVVPGAHTNGSRMMTEPALDAAGNIWTTWADGERHLYAAGTPDEGKTWPWRFDLTPHFRAASRDAPRCEPTISGPLKCDEEGSHPTHEATNGTYVWPWISAGSEGRFAVSWIGAYPVSPSDEQNGPWYIFTAYVIDATTPAPSVTIVRLTPDPIHVNPICQNGTSCQVSSMTGAPAGDRRLGDFFETTVEPGTGFLMGAWSNTYAASADTISHPQFVRQTGGIRLLTDADMHAYRPTQG